MLLGERHLGLGHGFDREGFVRGPVEGVRALFRRVCVKVLEPCVVERRDVGADGHEGFDVGSGEFGAGGDEGLGVRRHPRFRLWNGRRAWDFVEGLRGGEETDRHVGEWVPRVPTQLCAT